MLWLVFTLCSGYSAAASMASEVPTARTELVYQKDNVTNQIPFFDNRFRIDAELDEVTLLFYRARGSKPIILVRPDGSKVRINDYDRDKVQWHDDSTFDMIKITKPMPGPWQAIGDILPESKILVVSDIKIAVEPLPEIVLAGETLKVTGKLFNNDDDIDTPHFRNVVKVDVHFYSTNNSIYENFGADAIKVTSFRDDGENLDEYAADSIFTGEFILDFAPGEWQPVYLVKLPMATRELRQKPVILYSSPVSIEVEPSTSAEIAHQMILTINPDYVDPDSMIFQGKVTFPDRQVEPFSIMEAQGTTRLKGISYTEAGLHRVSINAFGRTTSGREFRLVLPEFTFNVKEPENLLLPVIDDNGVEQPRIIKSAEKTAEELAAELAAAALLQQQLEDEKNLNTVIIIAAGNVIIIVIAIGLFFMLRRGKGKAQSSV